MIETNHQDEAVRRQARKRSVDKMIIGNLSAKRKSDVDLWERKI